MAILYFVNSKKTIPTVEVSDAAADAAAAATPLQHELVGRISRLIDEQGLANGTWLNENQLAAELGVSRTPVRAALDLLAARGFVRRERHLGVVLMRKPSLPAPAAAAGSAADDEDRLLLRIALDRHHGRLPDVLSEQHLMQTYGVGRPALRQLLSRLADLGLVERKLGYGWRFINDAWDPAARQESYRFRMTIEPAALREPGFALPAGWAQAMHERHQAALRARWNESSSVAFFEMNAAFHEGLAAASGNRYFLAAMQRQNRLRRLSNYDWKHGRERVEVNCREHLEILSRLQSGDQELAALLLQRHLEVASRLRSSAAA